MTILTIIYSLIILYIIGKGFYISKTPLSNVQNRESLQDSIFLSALPFYINQGKINLVIFFINFLFLSFFSLILLPDLIFNNTTFCMEEQEEIINPQNFDLLDNLPANNPHLNKYKFEINQDILELYHNYIQNVFSTNSFRDYQILLNFNQVLDNNYFFNQLNNIENDLNTITHDITTALAHTNTRFNTNNLTLLYNLRKINLAINYLDIYLQFFGMETTNNNDNFMNIIHQLKNISGNLNYPDVLINSLNFKIFQMDQGVFFIQRNFFELVSSEIDYANYRHLFIDINEKLNSIAHNQENLIRYAGYWHTNLNYYLFENLPQSDNLKTNILNTFNFDEFQEYNNLNNELIFSNPIFGYEIGDNLILSSSESEILSDY